MMLPKIGAKIMISLHRAWILHDFQICAWNFEISPIQHRNTKILIPWHRWIDVSHQISFSRRILPEIHCSTIPPAETIQLTRILCKIKFRMNFQCKSCIFGIAVLVTTIFWNVLQRLHGFFENVVKNRGMLLFTALRTDFRFNLWNDHRLQHNLRWRPGHPTN